MSNVQKTFFWWLWGVLLIKAIFLVVKINIGATGAPELCFRGQRPHCFFLNPSYSKKKTSRYRFFIFPPVLLFPSQCLVWLLHLLAICLIIYTFSIIGPIIYSFAVTGSDNSDDMINPIFNRLWKTVGWTTPTMLGLTMEELQPKMTGTQGFS